MIGVSFGRRRSGEVCARRILIRWALVRVPLDAARGPSALRLREPTADEKEKARRLPGLFAFDDRAGAAAYAATFCSSGFALPVMKSSAF